MNNNKEVIEGKYEVAGSRIISLPIYFASLPEKIHVEGREFGRRTSFHISLVCMERMVRKYGLSIPDLGAKVVEDFREFVRSNDIRFLRYRDEFRMVAFDGRCSIVVMCDVSGIGAFFDLINKKYGLKLDAQPTHVTLYTLKNDLGIYLIDQDDIQKITKVIPNPLGIAPERLN